MATANVIDSANNDDVASMMVDHSSAKRGLSMDESSDSDCGDTHGKSIKACTVTHKKKRLH